MARKRTISSGNPKKKKGKVSSTSKSMEETAKAMSTEAYCKLELQQIEAYRISVRNMKICVLNSLGCSAKDFDFEDESILTADLKKVLKMEPWNMLSLKEFMSSDFGAHIKRGDGSRINCIIDLAKYALYNERLGNGLNYRGSIPNCSHSMAGAGIDVCQINTTHCFKKCLDEVTEIAKIYSGKQAKVTPTADFKDDLGMSIDDVYLFSNHLDRLLGENCGVHLLDAVYDLRLRCCQDVADVICHPDTFVPLEEEEEDKNVKDPFFPD
ncbi:hypothetical protein OROHE_002583 [Orobanche hederae]